VTFGIAVPVKILD